ncbi:MAG: hypothetical protein KDC07_04620 [Chitinophagaceae bacterium]|nr:hypothetical protein [Chitinophagaceae bacterium]MCB9044998.1 hypothetical protein [Chitinophagales bacterium]
MNEEKLKIIYVALDSLDSNPLFKGMWKYVVHTGERIEISLYIRDMTLKYVVETRAELREQQLPKLLSVTGIKETIIIAGKISATAKEQLVTNGIAYIESNGNVFIPKKDLYIWIDSNKQRPIAKENTGRAFTKTGLKVVFHFLMNEAFLDMSYRQIARETNTSLGNITNIINALKQLNFLEITPDGKLRLRQKRLLAERWIEQYEHRLKPAIEIGTFRFESEDDYRNWKRTQLENKKSMWGGEPGGHLLTGMLKPTQLTIYSLENRHDLMKNYRLVRDEKGYIKVFRKFWTYDDYRTNVAPPLLVYADLLNSGLQGNIEAAERIFDDVLKNRF